MITCGKCVYWLKTQGKGGECRIGPPVVPPDAAFNVERFGVSILGMWPATKDDSGCWYGRPPWQIRDAAADTLEKHETRVAATAALAEKEPTAVQENSILNRQLVEVRRNLDAQIDINRDVCRERDKAVFETAAEGESLAALDDQVNGKTRVVTGGPEGESAKSPDPAEAAGNGGGALLTCELGSVPSQGESPAEAATDAP